MLGERDNGEKSFKFSMEERKRDKYSAHFDYKELYTRLLTL